MLIPHGTLTSPRSACPREIQPKRIASALLGLAARHGNIAAVPEIARFAIGAKGVIRLVVSAGAHGECDSLSHSLGLHCVFKALYVVPVGGTWRTIHAADTAPNESDTAAAYFSFDRSASLCAMADAQDSKMAGELFGYPPCCVATIGELADAGGAWPQVLVQRSGKPATWHAAANRIVADWGGIPPSGELFPCRLSCELAAALGAAGFEALELLGLRRLAGQIRDGATRPWVLTHDGRARPSLSNSAFHLPWP